MIVKFRTVYDRKSANLTILVNFELFSTPNSVHKQTLNWFLRTLLCEVSTDLIPTSVGLGDSWTRGRTIVADAPVTECAVVFLVEGKRLWCGVEGWHHPLIPAWRHRTRQWTEKEDQVSWVDGQGEWLPITGVDECTHVLIDWSQLKYVHFQASKHYFINDQNSNSKGSTCSYKFVSVKV